MRRLIGITAWFLLVVFFFIGLRFSFDVTNRKTYQHLVGTCFKTKCKAKIRRSTSGMDPSKDKSRDYYLSPEGARGITSIPNPNDEGSILHDSFPPGTIVQVTKIKRVVFILPMPFTSLAIYGKVCVPGYENETLSFYHLFDPSPPIKNGKFEYHDFYIEPCECPKKH